MKVDSLTESTKKILNENNASLKKLQKQVGTTERKESLELTKSFFINNEYYFKISQCLACIFFREFK